MKTNNLKFIAACLGLSSIPALAQQRIVVSYPQHAIEIAAQSVTAGSRLPLHCITLTQGNSWCVPVPGKRQGISAQHRNVEPLSFRSISLTVPDGLSVYAAQALLLNTGLYSHVEPDVQISSSATLWNESTPDDESFFEQTFFADNSSTAPTASSVLSMWRMLQAPQKNIDVYVLDAGFRLHDDMSFATGFNFVTMEEGDIRGPGFLEADYGDGSCPNNHGIAVASVIGAGINNGKGIAGISGDITVHPLRVMKCGAGVMSDAAAALEWLAGDTIAGLPDFAGEPGVVNMSLGGKVGEAACPFYLQNAIDKATGKGFTLVVSAGNQGGDAMEYIPAKCDNVITVGAATDGDQYNSADIASFSNYGRDIDIMARGENVPGLSNNNSTMYWSGTSFAAPIVAGIIANAQKDFAFTPEQWHMLVLLSGSNRWVEGNRCETLGCGAGILDAAVFYNNAQRLQYGELNAADFVLNAVPACRHSWMLQHLPQGTSLCDQVSVEVNTLVDKTERDVIRLSAADGNSLSQSTALTRIGDFTAKRFVVDKADVLGKTIYAQLCDTDTTECSELVRINSSALDNIPAVCQ